MLILAIIIGVAIGIWIAFEVYVNRVEKINTNTKKRLAKEIVLKF